MTPTTEHCIHGTCDHEDCPTPSVINLNVHGSAVFTMRLTDDERQFIQTLVNALNADRGSFVSYSIRPGDSPSTDCRLCYGSGQYVFQGQRLTCHCTPSVRIARPS